MKRRRRRKNPKDSPLSSGLVLFALAAAGFIVVVGGLKKLSR